MTTFALATLWASLFACNATDCVDQDLDGVCAEEDCNDADADVHPGADELCDGLDNDCDGTADDDPVDGPVFFLDRDGDLYGDPESTVRACTQPSGTATNGADCDDTDQAFRPGAPEDDCTDPNDYNCDGSVGFEDLDGDGWAACEECDDAHAESFPGAEEVCDGLDNDCDGTADVNALDARTFYGDADGDGFGGQLFTIEGCEAPESYVDNDTDCDDLDATANPDGIEVCDGADNDCNGVADDDALDAQVWFEDADGDGYGDPESEILACEPPSTATLDTGDCDDTDQDVHPEAEEVCNDGVDNNCDGGFDGCALSTADADGELMGADASEALGVTLASADFNGDGQADLLIGSPLEATNGYAAGAGYVVFGPLTAGTSMDLANADAVLTGAESSQLGKRAEAAGDLNGDGYEDLILTAHRDDTGATAAGAATVVYGPLSGDVDLSTATSGYTRWAGESNYDRVGLGVAGLGDVDGDGLDDVAIGAPYYDPSSSNKDAGGVYLLLGANDWGAEESLADADAVLEGESASDEVGRALAGLDWDGDGLSDLVVGVPADSSAGSDAGAVVWFSGSGVLSATSLSDGAAIEAENAGDAVGQALAPAGDVDGDGYADLILGAPGEDSGGTDAGAAYVVLGSFGGPSLSTLAAADAKLTGAAADQAAGIAVSGGGDLDGDGSDDVVVGAWQAGTLGQGAAYVVSGSSLSGTVDLGEQPVVEGTGVSDALGQAVLLGGDLDADGSPDLMLGAPGSDGNGTDAGAVFLLFELGL